MDWTRGTHNAGAAKVNEPPVPEPFEVCWELRSPSGRVITCAIYRDAAPGIDVRCTFSEDDVVRSQRCAEIGTARELADEWRAGAVAKGFLELREGQT